MQGGVHDGFCEIWKRLIKDENNCTGDGTPRTGRSISWYQFRTENVLHRWSGRLWKPQFSLFLISHISYINQVIGFHFLKNKETGVLLCLSGNSALKDMSHATVYYIPPLSTFPFFFSNSFFDHLPRELNTRIIWKVASLKLEDMAIRSVTYT